MTEEEKTLKYLSAMRVIDFNKLGFVYGKETITDILNLIQKQQEEIEKKEDTISEYENRLIEKQLTVNKLKTLAGLALKRGPLEISKKTFRELGNMTEIEQTENIMHDSYIFRVK